jgi:hypothetical protein
MCTRGFLNCLKGLDARQILPGIQNLPPLGDARSMLGRYQVIIVADAGRCGLKRRHILYIFAWADLPLIWRCRILYARGPFFNGKRLQDVIESPLGYLHPFTVAARRDRSFVVHIVHSRRLIFGKHHGGVVRITPRNDLPRATRNALSHEGGNGLFFQLIPIRPVVYHVTSTLAFLFFLFFFLLLSRTGNV